MKSARHPSNPFNKSPLFLSAHIPQDGSNFSSPPFQRLDLLAFAWSGGDKQNWNNNQNTSSEGGGGGGGAGGAGGAGGGEGGGGGFLGGMTNKLNSAAGGGRESEKNEDLLDKGVDAVQQYGLGEGDQSNESAFEQAKDEQISDEIRRQFKSATSEDVPIKDKETRFG